MLLVVARAHILGSLLSFGSQEPANNVRMLRNVGVVGSKVSRRIACQIGMCSCIFQRQEMAIAVQMHVKSEVWHAAAT